MARRHVHNRDIEELLTQLETGDISEDDVESDGDELDYYPTHEQLVAELEDEEVEEEMETELEDIDPPLVNDCEDAVLDSQSSQNISQNARKSLLDTQRLRWKKRSMSFSEDKIKFTGPTDFPGDIMSLETPYQFFSYFFPPHFIDKIIEQTNVYSVQKQPDRPENINKIELQKYIGILIFMSVYHYPSVRSYWNTKHGFQGIKEAMPVNRFEKIRRSLHFNNNDQHKPVDHSEHDRLHKLRPVIDHLNTKFSSVPLDQRLSIDEQMCATKIGHFLKQYLPNKPHKWGFKLFMLCSLMGYAYRFIIYSGKDTDPMLETETDVGTVGNTVIKLTRIIPRQQNHILYFDNFYTSLPLMYYMAKEGISCLGTVQRNRLGKNCKIPTKQDVMKKSIARGSYEEYMTRYDDVEMSAVSWKDNRQVVLLSTYVGASPVGTIERYDKTEKRKKSISCPKVVSEYNAHMGGVDLMDSYLGRYRIRMKTRKWYMRIFYHLLDLSVINSWVLYRQVCARKEINPKQVMKLVDFRTHLADTLCNYGAHVHTTRGRPSFSSVDEPQKKKRNVLQVMPSTDVRYDGIGHMQIKTDKRMKCIRRDCKLLSSVMCEKCKVYLCSKKNCDCFNIFHKQT